MIMTAATANTPTCNASGDLRNSHLPSGLNTAIHHGHPAYISISS